MTAPLALFQNLGITEILIIGLVVLLLFGSRLPTVARSIGQSFTQFKKGLRDDGSPKDSGGGDADGAPR